MKKLILSALTVVFSLTACAQNQDIKLPEPVKTGGKPLMDCLAERKTLRDFDETKTLDRQTLSNLLWATYGYNREDKRTAPTSRNKQEMDIIVALPEGAYWWDAKMNVLKLIAKGDFRKQTGSQPFVEKAAVNLVFVCDIPRSETGGDNQKLTEATYANAGFMSQNVYLFCASEGLGTVVRGYVPKDELSKLLGLGKDKLIVLAQSVGYVK
ncbi:MAG: SagB/ThcOx family dehydrogenase [Prevotellaceae bacterium]|jgi:nitroreductase|nr:SagB/ThcOx family dehydrogenase [Prevotellaceae bacterium]